MSPRLVQFVALLVTLAQLASAAGAGLWTAAFGHEPEPLSHRCTGPAAVAGTCGHNHPPSRPLPHSPHAHCTPAAHAHCTPAAHADWIAPVAWTDGDPSHCCECPHAHDHRGPQAPASPRDGDNPLARPAPAAILAVIPPGLPPTPVHPAMVRYLMAGLPPPIGLKTTRLLI